MINERSNNFASSLHDRSACASDRALLNPIPHQMSKADWQKASVTPEMKLPWPLKAIILKNFCGVKCGVKIN